MGNRKTVYRAHAFKRMFERGIAILDVERVIAIGDVIEEYPNDFPYPSRLILGWTRNQPIHVVVADNTDDNELIVITAYEPDPIRWDQDFRRRNV